MYKSVFEVIFLKKSMGYCQEKNLISLNKNGILLFKLYAFFYYKHCILRKSRVLKKRKKYESAVFLFLWGLQQKTFVPNAKRRFVDILYTYYLSSFFFFFKLF